MKLSTVRSLFKTVRYTPFHPQWFAYRYEKLRYTRTGKISKGMILDIGCGRQPLRQYLDPSTTYITLDFPETGAVLYGARPNVFGDACTLPFKDRTFDTVVMLEILEHLPNPKRAIEEAFRVVKQEGQVILSAPFLYPIHDAPRDYQRWTQHGLEELLRAPNIKIKEHYNLGSPLETGVLLLNLSLAWNTIEASKKGRLFLIPIAIAMIPLLNTLAFVISSLFKVPPNSPFTIGYLYVAQESKQ